MKYMKIILVFICALGFISSGSVLAAEQEDNNILQWDISKNVPVDKEWRIKFNQPVNGDVLYEDFIYVQDEKQNRISAEVAFDQIEKQLVVSPPAGGYDANQTYTLIIEEGLTSEKNGKLTKSIHKQFTTNGDRLEEEFIPRSASKNNITVVDNFYTLKEAQMLSFDYKSGNVKIDKTTKYKTGDMLYFPETEEFPFGFIGKATKIIEEADSYTVIFVDPEMDEYIEDIDISKEIDITADDVTISEDLTQEGFSDTYRETLGVKNSYALLKPTKNGFIIELAGVGREFEKGKDYADKLVNVQGEGGFSLDGEIEFMNITPHFDMTKTDKVADVGVSSSQEIRLNAKAYGNFVGTMELPLINQGIPKLSINVKPIKSGLFFESYLVLRFTADGNVSVTIKQAMSQDVGVKQNNSVYAPYAKFSKGKLNPTVNEAKIKLQFDKGFRMSFKFYLAQKELAFAGIEPEIQSTFTVGQLYENHVINSCYELGVDLHFAAKVGVGSETWTPYDRQHNLTRNTNCVVPALKFKEAELKVSKSDQLKLPVKGVLSDGTEIDFSLPHKYITFRSNSKYISVNNQGYISVSPQAPDGLQAIIHIEMRYNGKFYSDQAKLIVEKSDEEVGNAIVPVKYARSFEFVNNGSITENVKIEKYGHFISYYPDGRVYRQSLNSSSDLYIPAGGNAYLSYLTPINEQPFINGKNITVKETGEPAYQAYRLHQHHSANISSESSADASQVYIEDTNNLGKFSYVSYSEKQTVQNFGRLLSATANSGVSLPKSGKMVIENPLSQPFTVYVARDSGLIAQTTEKPLIEKKVKPNQAVKIASSEQVSTYSSSSFSLATDAKEAKFERVELRKDGTVIGFYKEDSINGKSTSRSIASEGSTYISNISEDVMTIYGPTKYMSFEDVANPIIRQQILKPGESFKLTSTEPINTYSTSDISVLSDVNQSKFEHVSLDEEGKVYAFYKELAAGTTRVNVGVRHKGEAYIKNVSNSAMTVYGPAKYVAFQKTDEPLITQYQLKPGESVKLTSTEPINRYSTSDISVLSDVNQSKFEHVSLDEDGKVYAFYKELAAGPTRVSVGVRHKGEAYIKNVSNSVMTVYGPEKYVSFQKTDEPLITQYQLKPGESVKLTSTEPINTYSTSDISVLSDVEQSKFEYVSLEEDEKVFAFYKGFEAGPTRVSVGVRHKGEAYIKNVSNSVMTVYGPAKYISIQKTERSLLTEYVLNPGQSVTVTSTEPINIYSSSDFSLLAQSGSGAFKAEPYKENGELYSMSEGNLESNRRNIKVYYNGSTKVTNTGSTPLVVYGTAKYINFR